MYAIRSYYAWCEIEGHDVINNYIPGSPDQHVGYFGLLDEFGNPLHTAKGSDKYRRITSYNVCYTKLLRIN